MFKKIAVLAGSASLPVVSFAQSAPGAELFTDMGSTAATYISAGFVLLAVVMGGTVGMKLVKKIISKAT